MADLHDLTRYLDKKLNIAEIPDYPGALNGLQIENGGIVNKVVAAVDASLPVFEKAIEMNADLLIVHHGMFWQGTQRITGAVYKKIKMAMDAGMALYSSHIPLDVHPLWGNNAQLASKVGMDETTPFFDWKGIKLGVYQHLDIEVSELLARIETAVDGSVHICRAGGQQAGKVGIITGGAGSEVAAMADCGIDTFVTGEGPHWSYPLAEELGINVIYGGHYATETFGVRALALHLEQQFDLKSAFLHHPTGL